MREAHKLPIFVASLCLAGLFTLAASGSAQAAINIIDIRNKYTSGGILYNYEPGTPSQSVEPAIKYTITTPGTYRIKLYDRGANVNRLDIQVTHSTTGTFWLAGTTITWKSTPDSYEYQAYQRSGTSTWTKQDSAIGPVTADSTWGYGQVNWSPNQWTWGYRVNFNPASDFVDYRFHFWWFDHPASAVYRGLQRVTLLDDWLSNLPGQGQLQTEFLRTRPYSTDDQDGWDAFEYDPIYLVLIPYGAASNIYDWYEEGEEEWVGVDYYLGENEEVQIITSDEDDLVSIAGGDPSGFYANGYYTNITFWRHPGWRGSSFWMRIGFEAKEWDWDTSFDGADAAIHTTTF